MPQIVTLPLPQSRLLYHGQVSYRAVRNGFFLRTDHA